MSSTDKGSAGASDRLLGVLGGYARVVVVMHDNPDPDAIASGWAVQRLVEERLGREARLVGGGAIVRAENKCMVELLSPPLELVTGIEVDDATAVVLVDCGLGKANHLVTRESLHPVGVIDHHVGGESVTQLPFHDIRPNVVASASIAAGYLREQRIEPGRMLSTAVLYAIRSEARGNAARYSKLDSSVVKWLTGIADASLLADIENAPLEREYFADLLLAMQNTFLYDGAALCFLPRAASGEIVGEVADLLIRCRGVHHVLCAAVIDGDVVLSARTERHFGNAAELLQVTLEGLGGCGGHAHRAGGTIRDAGRDSKISQRLHDELRDRWLAACGADGHRGTRLVPSREIVANL